MQRVRVDIQLYLSTCQPRVCLAVLEDLQAGGRVCLGRWAREDVAVQVIDEGAGLREQVGRQVTNDSVESERRFRGQRRFPALVAQHALVHSLGEQLLEGGGAECAAEVRGYGEVASRLPRRADGAADRRPVPGLFAHPE